MDLGLLIGLIAIALGLFSGLFFGLSGFRKGVTDKLSDVENRVVAIGVTVEKAWDLISRRWSEEGSTVERSLDNLGKVKISAEPGPEDTNYTIEIEKSIFHQEYLLKVYKERGLVDSEKAIFGKEITIRIAVFSPTRMRLTLPCVDSKLCTKYMTLVLEWLNSEYIAALPKLKDFEEPILS